MAVASELIVVDKKVAQSMILSRNLVKDLKIKRLLKYMTVLVYILLIMNIELPDSSRVEAKKLKLKDLKKLKKYAYLAAGMSSKFYAIPFPLPLPVFIKRQHIYTQIPIIPRYVDPPKSTLTYSTGASISDSYESSSTGGSYAQESSRVPEYQSYASPAKYRKSHYDARQIDGLKSSGSSNRYFRTLAGVFGSMPVKLAGASGHRDIIHKLMNGQAKVISPVSFLSRLRGPMQAPGEQDQKHNDLQGSDDASYFLNDTKAESSNIEPQSNHQQQHHHHRPQRHPSSMPSRGNLRIVPSLPGSLLSPLQASQQTDSSTATRLPAMSVLNAPLPNDLLSMLEPQVEANTALESHANQVIAVEAPQMGPEMYADPIVARQQQQQQQLLETLEQLRAQQIHQRQQEALHEAIAQEQYESNRLLARQQAVILQAHQFGPPEQVVSERLQLLGY